MSSQLSVVAGRMPDYELSLSKSDAEQLWAQGTEGLRQWLATLPSSLDAGRLLKQGLDEPGAFEGVWARRELIRVFAGTELDDLASGKRGLGRTTTGMNDSWGRFATTHPKALAVRNRASWGRMMEEVVLCGCLAGVAMAPLRINGPFPSAGRTDDETFQLWVPALASGYLNDSDVCTSVTGLLLEESPGAGSAFVSAARDAGLIKGLSKQKREAEIWIRLLLYAGAGIALVDVGTTRWDDVNLQRDAITGGGWSQYGGRA